ncbi:PREDICTED: centrosomal protein of 44 kDa isoform X4 [Chinchilla lanigera]|uniref:centrosomal protein of 44 kDa isoform X4 n=1 Tax=Chinchilla lanigera TaxID=34839 RepID=UPI000696C6F7|nr:PREDICTED: centrosomal protein of 44 kDa isoform X4 [Chinchilla lanigera]
MATGDLKRSLRKLEQALRSLNYPKEVDYVGLIKGDTAAVLPIISYSLTSYSPYVTEHLMECNVELIAKNDLRFTDTVFKSFSSLQLLRDQFDYKPILTKKQFMQHGFAEWKIEIICDILSCVMKKHKELSRVDKKKALVIRHLYNENDVNIPEDTENSVTDDNEICDVSDLKASAVKVTEAQVSETKAEEEGIKSNREITALQTMLAECQEKLTKLSCIEKRLDCLEEAMKGKVIVDEKTWTNLLSRITLLETEMLLSKKNEYVEVNAVSDNYTSSGNIDLVTLDGKIKMERPANIPLSSGYNTQSPDSTPRTSTINYCGLKDISEETTIQKMERMKKMFEETAELLKCPSH